MNDYIQVRKKDLEFLVDSAYEMALLDAYGVDNWPAYDDAVMDCSENEGISLWRFRDWLLRDKLTYLGINFI